LGVVVYARELNYEGEKDEGDSSKEVNVAKTRDTFFLTTKKVPIKLYSFYLIPWILCHFHQKISGT